jgi:hypothetical protein
MDDKVFIFFILIPAGVLLINFLLLRKADKGMRLFYIFAGCIIGYIITAKLVTHFFPHLIKGLSGAVGIIAYWYLLMIITLIVSIAYSIANQSKRKKME